MDDAESPQDAENGKSDQARRAGMRLPDAEAVATTRRDMFGDGSLLDAFAPPSPEEPSQTDPRPAPAAEAQPLDAEPGEAPPADVQPQSAPQADAQPPGAEPDDAQPAVPMPAAWQQGADGEPGKADAGRPASLAEQPQSLDAIIDSFPAEAADPGGSDAEQPGPDPMLPPPFAGSDQDAGAGGPPAGQASVSSIFDAIGSGEAEEQPAAGQWDMAGHDGAPDEAMPGDDAQDEAASGAPAESPAWSAEPAGSETAPEPPAVPPLAEPSAGEPPHYAETGGLPPFPELPPLAPGVSAGWPPFPEPPGTEPGPVSSEPSVLPPFIELPAAPEPDAAHYAEPPPDAAEAPAHAEPLHGDGFSELPATEAPSYAGPAGAPPYEASARRPELDGVAGAAAQATAKIAAEASATAQALDSLQRLLNQSVPNTGRAQQPVPDQSLSAAHLNLRDDSNPFPPTPPAPFTTLTMPPSESGRGKSVYLLGFFTGVGLSLMAGIALYFLINTG